MPTKSRPRKNQRRKGSEKKRERICETDSGSDSVNWAEWESVEELLSEMDLHRFYWPKHSVQIFLQMQIVSGGLWFKVKERNGKD